MTMCDNEGQPIRFVLKKIEEPIKAEQAKKKKW